MEVLNIPEECCELFMLLLGDDLPIAANAETEYCEDRKSLIVRFASDDAITDGLLQHASRIQIENQTFTARRLERSDCVQILNVVDKELVLLFFEDLVGPISHHEYHAEEQRLVISFENHADVVKMLKQNKYRIDDDTEVFVRSSQQQDEEGPFYMGATADVMADSPIDFNCLRAVRIQGLSHATSKSAVELELTKKWKPIKLECPRLDWNPSAGTAVITFTKSEDVKKAVNLGSKQLGRQIVACDTQTDIAELLGDLAVLVENISSETSKEALWCWLKLAFDKFPHTVTYSESYTEAVALFTYYFGFDLERAQVFANQHMVDTKRLRLTIISRTMQLQMCNVHLSVSAANLQRHLEGPKGVNRQGAVKVEIKGNGIAVATFADESDMKVALAKTHTLCGHDLWLTPYFDALGIVYLQQVNDFAVIESALLAAGNAADSPPEITVTGFEDKDSSTLQKYFTQRTMSGGGDIASFCCADGKAVITFRQAETADRVFQKYQADGLKLGGCKLVVKLKSFKLDPNAYKQRILAKNFGEASEDSLKYFLWGLSNTKVDQIEYVYYRCRPQLCAIVHFDSNVDFCRIVPCLRAVVLDGLYLEAEQIASSRSVLVRNVPERVYDDLLKLTFSGDVEECRCQQPSGEWVVTFTNPEDAKEALRQRVLYDGVDLVICEHSEFEAAPNARQKGKRGQRIMVLHTVDSSVLKFVLMKRKDDFDQLLKQADCSLVADANRPPYLVSTVGPADPKYKNMARRWPKVEEIVNTFFGRFLCLRLNVLSSIWDSLTESAVFQSIEKQDKGSIETQTLQPSTGSAMELRITGVQQLVQQAWEKLTAEVKIISDVMEREKTRTTDVRTGLPDWFLNLLQATGFCQSVQARCADVRVELNFEGHEVRFEGLPSDILCSQNEMSSLFKNSSEEIIYGPAAMIKLLQKGTVQQYMNEKLKEAGLDKAAVWQTKSSTAISIYGVNATAASDAATIVRGGIINQSIPLDEDAAALESSEKWKTMLDNVCAKREGDVVVERVNNGGNMLQLSCKACHATAVVEEVQEFLRRHIMKKEFVGLPPLMQTFLLKFLMSEIKQIEKNQSHNFVKFRLPSELEQEMNAKKAGWFIEGNADGIINARRALVSITKKYKVKKHSLHAPGVATYLRANEGILDNIGRDSETVIVLSKGDEADSDMSLDESGLLSAAELVLPNGVKLLVLKGDMVRLECDAIVNAANSQLQHSGGLARIIADAGGPQINEECQAYIKKNGQLGVGQACITSGGDLPCKKVIHAVGPQWQGGKSNEVNKLYMAVQNSLTLASQNGCSSVALPAIGSGIFGYPLDQCTQTIVESVADFCSSAGSIKQITLLDIKDDGVKSFKCAVEQLRRGSLGAGTSGTKATWRAALTDRAPMSTPEDQPGASPKSAPGAGRAMRVLHTLANKIASPFGSQLDLRPFTVNGIKVKIVVGSLIDQRADVFVNTVGSQLDLNSGMLCQIINKAAGPRMQQHLTQSYPNGINSGDIAISPGFNLGCQLVFHACCCSWNNGAGEQVLAGLLSQCLREANKRGVSSIAIPAVGCGVLGFPPGEGARITYDAILRSCRHSSSSSIRNIKVAVFGVQSVIDAFQTRHSTILQQAASNEAEGHQHSASRGQEMAATEKSVRSGGAADHILLGPVKVQVLHGSLADEKTDIIVNSTDKQLSLQGQVARALVDKGGQAVSKECQAKGHIGDEGVFLASGAKLNSKYILHVDADLTMNEIIRRCLEKAVEVKAQSISFPAVGTGVKKGDPSTVAYALMKGVDEFVRETDSQQLCEIRFVIFDSQMVNSFRTAMQAIASGEAAATRGTSDGRHTFEASSAAGKTSSLSVALLVYGKEDNIRKACKALDDHCHGSLAQCTVPVQSDVLGGPTEEQTSDFVQYGMAQGVAVEIDRPGSKILLKSLDKKAIDTVQQYIQGALQNQQFLQLHQDILCAKVQWQYRDKADTWCNYSPSLNYKLEAAFKGQRQNMAYSGANGEDYVVDLKLLKDCNGKTADAVDIRRQDLTLVNSTAAEPQEWTAASGYFEEVLRPQAQEYSRVKDAFFKTIGGQARQISEIKRIQNPMLWSQFTVQSKKTKDSMQPGTSLPVERWLWHGTAESAVKNICMQGFNRSYCGKNAVAYGQGVYFACDSSYSASATYSVPNQLGYKHMIYSRVLTGEFMLGNQQTRVPAVKQHNPNFSYDTTVDNLQNPGIFVIYHDAQAYPAYVVTFM